MRPHAKAKVMLGLDQVPPLPPGVTLTEQPNGEQLAVAGDRRWRYAANGRLKYYFRCQPGKGRDVVPYEEMYRI